MTEMDEVFFPSLMSFPSPSTRLVHRRISYWGFCLDCPLIGSNNRISSISPGRSFHHLTDLTARKSFMIFTLSVLPELRSDNTMYNQSCISHPPHHCSCTWTTLPAVLLTSICQAVNFFPFKALNKHNYFHLLL